MQSLINVSLILVSILSVLISLLILFRAPKKLLNITFFISALSCAGWVFGIAGFYLTNNLDHAVYWAKFYYTMPLILFAACTVLADLFPRGKSFSTKRTLFISIWCLAIVIPLLFNPTFLTSDIVQHDWGKEIILGKTEYLLYVLYVSFCFGSILYSGLKMRKKETGVFRAQVSIFLSGVIISAIFGTLFNLYLPLFGNYKLIWIGPLLSAVYVFVTSYAIVKQKLFDVRLVVARSIAYLGSIAVVAGLFGFIVFTGLAFIFDQKFSLEVQIVLSLATAGIAMSFARIKKFFDRVSSRLFYRDSYDAQDFLDKVNRVLVSSTDVTALLTSSSETIEKNLKSQFCFFELNSTSYAKERVVGDMLPSLSPSEEKTVKSVVRQIPRRVIVADDLIDTHPALFEILRKHNIAIVARLTTSLRHSEGDLGYVALGDKLSGNPYSKDDTDVIQLIATELVIAIENALRFEEIENFNVTLQQKVDDATKRLKKANEKLKTLDETKDEFISMASHQLRTPLTSVKGYVSMVLEGDAGPLNDMQKKLLEQSFTSSQRMVFLIADLLNLSRLKTGKFVIENVPCNLANVIEGEVEQLKETAAGKNMTLVYSPPKNFPTYMLDETKIRQVIMNFVDNAIYYTPAGGKIEISLTEKDKSIEFTVKDNGIGVPEAEQHHLFNKFFRAKNAQKARPDGTGLGLFMAKKVIVAQGGALIFSSTVGKGSTFGFSFAKDKLKVDEPAKEAAPAK